MDARWGRIYFGVQAFAGAAWWVAVFASPSVRGATLGDLDPVAVAVVDIPLFVIASAVAACGVKPAAIASTCWTGLVAVTLAVYATITTEAGWGVLVMVAASAGSVVALCWILRGRVPTEWLVRGPFAFRPANVRASVAMHVATTSGQIAFFWGVFLVAIPSAIAALEERWTLTLVFAPPARVVGVVILALASIIGLWSAFVMATLGAGTPLPSAMPNRLVIVGPYRWIRNPMAVAGIAQGLAVGLIVSSWLVVVYAIVGSLVWNYAVRPLEEFDLEERFGEEFRRYCDAVSCWIPRAPKAATSA